MELQAATLQGVISRRIKQALDRAGDTQAALGVSDLNAVAASIRILEGLSKVRAIVRVSTLFLLQSRLDIRIFGKRIFAVSDMILGTKSPNLHLDVVR